MSWSNTDAHRGSAHERGYGARWTAARAGYIRSHPLCVCCKANGHLSASAIVDHVVPHKGNMTIFWDSSKWQSLCNDCHGRIKQVLEHRYEQGLIAAEQLHLARPLPEFFAH